VVACSNSKKALRIEETDRRWFYPKLSENAWGREKWGEFYQWLNSGGLNIVMNWAMEHGNYILPGEHAPMTVDKQALIDDSKGDVLNHWIDILAAAEQEGESLVFALSEVKEALRKCHGRIYESPLQFKKEALKRDWTTVDDRLPIDGSLSYVVISPAMEAIVSGCSDPVQRRSALKSALKRVSERLQGGSQGSM
jgi:hypothetical protein